MSISRTELVLSRTITVNGEEHIIKVNILKSKENMIHIVTKKTFTDIEGNEWNVDGEEEILSRHDPFG